MSSQTTTEAFRPLVKSATHDRGFQRTRPMLFRTVAGAAWEGGPAPQRLRMQVTWPNAKGRNLRVEGLRQHPNPPWPVVVIAHGGGWLGGSFKGSRKLAGFLATRGLVCVSVDYRIPVTGPVRKKVVALSMGLGSTAETAKSVLAKSGFPGAIRDVKAAVRLVKAEATYGLLSQIGDPERVGVCGTSAGASVMAVLAVTDRMRIDASAVGQFDDFDLEGIGELDPESERKVTTAGGVVDAATYARDFGSGAAFAALIATPHPNLVEQLDYAVGTSGGTTGAGLKAYIGSDIGKSPASDPKSWADASPRTYLVELDDDFRHVVTDAAGALIPAPTLANGVGLPPFMFFHGEADISTPYSGIEEFVKFIEAAHGEARLFSLGRKAGHGSWKAALDRIAGASTFIAYGGSPADHEW